jgi:hypothetical protein
MFLVHLHALMLLKRLICMELIHFILWATSGIFKVSVKMCLISPEV